jgi:molybdopterin converting factor small subunit
VATVRLFAAARAAAGVASIEVPATTVAQALQAAVDQHPGLARVLPQCSVLLDEVACREHGTEIGPGAVIDVLPPFAGG